MALLRQACCRPPARRHPRAASEDIRAAAQQPRVTALERVPGRQARALQKTTMAADAAAVLTAADAGQPGPTTQKRQRAAPSADVAPQLQALVSLLQQQTLASPSATAPVALPLTKEHGPVVEQGQAEEAVRAALLVPVAGSGTAVVAGRDGDRAEEGATADAASAGTSAAVAGADK
ncbi:unnamed protein product [Closterium sp. Naga37s-1]|nr:unnamed protein product [Closterium sp. Naga37s-1]